MSLIALAVSGRGVVDPDEPIVFADDEGFLRGRAAFETTRVYGGTPFRLDEHLDPGHPDNYRSCGRCLGSSLRLSELMTGSESLAYQSLASAFAHDLSCRDVRKLRYSVVELQS